MLLLSGKIKKHGLLVGLDSYVKLTQGRTWRKYSGGGGVANQVCNCSAQRDGRV